MATKQIRFSVDKNGKEIAHEWHVRAMRYVRVPLDAAREAVATGQATETHANHAPASPVVEFAFYA